MNITLITFTGDGAVKHYLLNLCNALSKENTLNIFLPSYIMIDGFDCRINAISFPFPSNLIKSMIKCFDPFLYMYLIKEIARWNPDVIHIPFELRFPFFYVFLLSHKCPVIVTLHEPRPFSVDKSVFNKVIAAVQYINCRLIIKFAEKVIVHGKQHSDYLLSKNVPSSKIRIIPHGDFSNLFPANSKIMPAKNNVLFFGEIKDYKGIEYLIEAGKIVKEVIPTVSITIAGKGDFSRYSRVINGDGIFEVINKFIPEGLAAELFQRASLVVLPYVDGSQSGIIGIAYAFEKPVIATDVGNFREMINHGETGLIVPRRDSHSLADAIIRLLKNDMMRMKMGMSGKKFINDSYDWGIIVEMLVDAYKESL